MGILILCKGTLCSALTPIHLSAGPSGLEDGGCRWHGLELSRSWERSPGCDWWAGANFAQVTCFSRHGAALGAWGEGSLPQNVQAKTRLKGKIVSENRSYTYESLPTYPMVIEMVGRGQKIWVLMPILPLTRCMTLGKGLIFTRPYRVRQLGSLLVLTFQDSLMPASGGWAGTTSSWYRASTI